MIWLTCKQKKLLFPAASNWQLWKLKIFPYRLLFLLISFGHISIPICYDILAVVLVSAEIFYSLSEYICLMPSWEMWQINYVFMTNKELRTGGHCFRLVLQRDGAGICLGRGCTVKHLGASEVLGATEGAALKCLVKYKILLWQVLGQHLKEQKSCGAWPEQLIHCQVVSKSPKCSWWFLLN